MGCLAYNKNFDAAKINLGPRWIRCVFVGYASNNKAYMLLKLECNVIIQEIDVEVFENLTTLVENSHVPTNEDSCEEDYSKVVTKQQKF